ncbi:MAG TPA: hypothetical protein VK483_17270 [Chitinophagaceae bacterium]|nr:hypothetical protein [Chitinophagaceae bacterium]
MNKIFTAGMLILLMQMNACGQAKEEKKFTESLMQDSCQFSVTGRNAYFILEPGYQLILEGREDNKSVRLVITVLNETKKIGNVETRVVEENESVNGKTIEISRNYFAFCDQTSSVYYFGEEVDMYSNGKIVSHEGAWTAEGKNKAGVMMPGLILLGARYYQEIAPGIAMDRAEVISTNEKMITPAGTYMNCLKVEETTPLEPKNKEYKFYASGIGLIRDGDLLLVKHGFIN